MARIRKLPKKYEDAPVKWLDKGWVDVHLEDWQRENRDDARKASLLTEYLPLGTYRKLAVLWGLDPARTPLKNGYVCKRQDKKEEDERVEEFIKMVERELGMRTDLSQDLQVQPVSSGGSSRPAKAKKHIKDNPYLRFLKKTGGLPTQQKKRTDLEQQAGITTKLIIKKFLEWYQSLGGNDGETFIEESTLEELFQIGFDMPAAKALAIRTQEMPTVPECLAHLRNEPKHSTRYCMKKILKRDIKMENMPTRMFAFGRMLPRERPSLRYKPPKNFVKKTWMECSRVPDELDTMKTVWHGLEKLRSTIAFSNWLKNHPEITPPPYLEAKGLLKINYEEWNQMYKGFEVDVDNLEVVSTTTDLLQENTSIKEEQESAPKLMSELASASHMTSTTGRQHSDEDAH